MNRIKFLPQASYNTRIAASGAASGASGVVGIGIVGVMIVGAASGATDKDARLINCYATEDGVGTDGKPLRYIMKRPGFASNTTPQAGSKGNAILVWTGQGAGTKLITAFGATNSSIYDGTTQLATNAGVTTAITGLATGITETVISGTATVVISSSDNTAWYYQDSGTVTKISDGDFPGNNSKTLAGTFAHLANYACIMSADGSLWVSDLGSITAWTLTSVITASTYPDKGIGCIRWKEMIMCFGTESIQFAQNSGLSPCPMSFVDSMTQRVGCVSAETICSLADNVFWCGSSPQGGLTVYQWNGQTTRLSNPALDHQLQVAGATNISMTTCRFQGRSFVVVMAGSSTYVYSLEDKGWHEWVGADPMWYRCVGLSQGASIVTYSISKSSALTGKTFVINPAALVFADNGAAYSAVMQTSNMDMGTNSRKSWTDLAVICDRELTTSTLSIAYSDDDYQSFTTWGSTDLSAEQQRMFRFGMSKQRAWKFTHSSATPMRIRAFEAGVVGHVN